MKPGVHLNQLSLRLRLEMQIKRFQLFREVTGFGSVFFLTSFVAIHGCRALLLIGCARSSGVDRGKDGDVPGLVTWANRNAYTAHTTQFASQNEVPCGWSSGVGMHGDLLHTGKDSGPGPKGDSKKGRGPAGITSMPEMC